jgi:hypothetical protein
MMRIIFYLLAISPIFCFSSSSSFRDTIQKYGHTNKDSNHSYIEPYERLLQPFINRSVRLLEIGVNFGGSAIMWHNFLPQSFLFLLDNRNVLSPNILSALNPDRYRFYLEDAYTSETVSFLQKESSDGFDIIIDDGPHSFTSQQFVIDFYLPLLKEGGILVIEDIDSIDIADLLKTRIPSDSDFIVEVIDLRNQKNRYDDILFVVKKPYHN